MSMLSTGCQNVSISGYENDMSSRLAGGKRRSIRRWTLTIRERSGRQAAAAGNQANQNPRILWAGMTRGNRSAWQHVSVEPGCAHNTPLTVLACATAVPTAPKQLPCATTR
jgi:hypothetical protein